MMCHLRGAVTSELLGGGVFMSGWVSVRILDRVIQTLSIL